MAVDTLKRAQKIFPNSDFTHVYGMTETTGMFSPLQAGFRKGRGCDDQIAKIIQAIKGFQAKRMEKSVLVLLDFLKAYDIWIIFFKPIYKAFSNSCPYSINIVRKYFHDNLQPRSNT